MFFSFSKVTFFVYALCIILTAFSSGFAGTAQAKMHKVAIANYGPHSSLDETITGIREKLVEVGFVPEKSVTIEVQNVGFDPSLIIQMLAQLRAGKPDVLIAITTPVAQTAKATSGTIPVVFADITDPVEAGLIPNPTTPGKNITGVSEKQDLDLLLQFVKQILPNATRVGLLYSTSEANDAALLAMMHVAAKKAGLTCVAIAIDQPRDIPMRMNAFKDKIDCLYLGTSGPIQPALPMIAAQANKMRIPVFNADSDAVKNNLVLGSYGVSYRQIGRQAGLIAAEILHGKPIAEIPPLYPNASEHVGFISQKRADVLGILIPDDLANITIIK
jgi:putative tryptophan/tyrosine transport system substrate-binding protein